MQIIKRYSNRKFYDTESKHYVTLVQLANFIQEGKEIQVIDNASGGDITALVLTQIIMDREKNRNGVVPRPVLANLIKAGGDAIGALQRTITSPLELWRQVDREIETRIQELVKRGDLPAEEGLQLREKLLSLTHRHNGSLWLSEQDLRRALDDRGAPTRADLDSISTRVEKLAADLDAIEGSTKPTRHRRAPTKKPTGVRTTRSGPKHRKAKV